MCKLHRSEEIRGGLMWTNILRSTWRWTRQYASSAVERGHKRGSVNLRKGKWVSSQSKVEKWMSTGTYLSPDTMRNKSLILLWISQHTACFYFPHTSLQSTNTNLSVPFLLLADVLLLVSPTTLHLHPSLLSSGMSLISLSERKMRTWDTEEHKAGFWQ